jgi:hypothetical protein
MTGRQNELTHARLLEAIHYDPETGIFRWPATARKQNAGKIAGTVMAEGRRQIKIDGEKFLSSRLAWFYVMGKWPDPEVDHEDVDPSNDRFANLREATRQGQGANRKLFKNNTSGFKGVYQPVSNPGMWVAQVKVDYKSRRIGIFDCRAAAAFAYLVAADMAWGEFARGG